GSPLEGIQKERKLLEPLLSMADFVVDTSDLKAAELRQRIISKYSAHSETQTMSLQVVSFGFKHGLPLNADLVVDVRFLPNPFFKEDLKKLSGLNPAVVEYVMAQPDTVSLLKH